MGKRSRQVQEQREHRALDAEQERLVRDARREAAVRGAAEGRGRGCLFCRRSDGGFTSVEHIVPESLGNPDVVLPVGVVCDRCNHSVLSRLDAALCDFGPVAFKDASGHPVEGRQAPQLHVRQRAAVSDLKAPGDYVLQLDSPKWRQDRPGPPGAFAFTAQRHDQSKKRLSLVHRALVKQAVEYAWLDLGPERVLGPEFDRERDIVLNGRHHGYLIVPRAGKPEDGSVVMQYWPLVRETDAHPYLFCFAGFYGVYLGTDTLFREPRGDASQEFNMLTF